MKTVVWPPRPTEDTGLLRAPCPVRGHVLQLPADFC